MLISDTFFYSVFSESKVHLERIRSHLPGLSTVAIRLSLEQTADYLHLKYNANGAWEVPVFVPCCRTLFPDANEVVGNDQMEMLKSSL